MPSEKIRYRIPTVFLLSAIFHNNRQKLRPMHKKINVRSKTSKMYAEGMREECVEVLYFLYLRRLYPSLKIWGVALDNEHLLKLLILNAPGYRKE